MITLEYCNHIQKNGEKRSPFLWLLELIAPKMPQQTFFIFKQIERDLQTITKVLSSEPFTYL